MVRIELLRFESCCVIAATSTIDSIRKGGKVKRSGYEAARLELEAHNAGQRSGKKDRSEKWDQKCEYCGASIPYEQRRNKFCGHSCAASISNTQRAVLKACARCSTSFVGSTKCCKSCIKAGRHHRGCGDIPFEELATDHSRRKYLLQSIGRVCQLCGITEWRGKPAPVVMDHIDGNADNNARSNLRLICPNCDAFSPTFSGRNRNKGRSTRRNSIKHRKN